MLLFSVAVALLTGILFGLSPALQLSRPDVSQVMQSSSRNVVGMIRGRTTNNVLIGAQIALTLVMLAGAGAAMKGFLRLIHTPLGYDPHNVMSVGIPVHDGAYPTWSARQAYFEQLLNKAATVPGVTMAAISCNATPPSNGWQTHVEILGQPPRDNQKVHVNFVSPNYFPLLRIPVAQGEIWDEAQNHNAAHVAVVNQTMARLYFPNGDALGHSLKVPEMVDEPPYTPPRRARTTGCKSSASSPTSATTVCEIRSCLRSLSLTRSRCACGRKFWSDPMFRHSRCCTPSERK